MSSGLEKNIRDQMWSVNNLIKEQEESLANKLHDKEGECQELAARLTEKTSELKAATAKVQHLSQVADEKNGNVEELHAKIEELQDISQEKHELELKNKALLERLSNKDSDNASLQMHLKDALGQNNARTLELQNLTRQIADRLQEKETDASDVSSLREEMACKLELERSKFDEAKRALQRHEEEKSKLEKELANIASEKVKFSRDLEELRALRANETASLERTRLSLTHAEQRIVNLKEKLKKSEFRTRDIQNALTQWAGKKSDSAELPEGFLDLDLDAMRILTRSILNSQRESEAAKGCLRAVLEIPETVVSEDSARTEKPSSSPAPSQETRSTEHGSMTVTTVPKITEGTLTGILSMNESGDGTAPTHDPAAVDTSKDSVRRIVVQSPFEEGKGLLPPSVEEERMSRRRYAQPLSILKSTTAPAIGNASPAPVSPWGQRASVSLSTSRTQSRSLSSSQRDLSVNTVDDTDNEGVDARTAGFLGRIKQSLGLQRSVSSDNGRKRKGSTSEGGNPTKAAKTWQSMFGTLDLETGDLRSSYFTAAGQAQDVTDAAEKRAPMLAAPNVKNTPRTNTPLREIVLGQQGRQGKARAIVRTYSKKPQEPGKE
ncbi:hypothetical protein VUR80DRAFT_6519 [Thermomyces stellatus]